MADIKASLPTGKHTVLDLYVTAKEAFAQWQLAPEQVKIIDVRTPEEYVFVGHATMARNIPLAFMTYQWNADTNEPVMAPNPEFLTGARKYFAPDVTLLVMCRSGGRSAMAVNALVKAGFTNVYNITDGMEGDKVSESGSVFLGQRMKNGWKNSGAPWTYQADPQLLWISPADK